MECDVLYMYQVRSLVVWFTVNKEGTSLHVLTLSLGKTRQVEEGKTKLVQNCVNNTWCGEGGGGGGGGILSMCVFLF